MRRPGRHMHLFSDSQFSVSSGQSRGFRRPHASICHADRQLQTRRGCGIRHADDGITCTASILHPATNAGTPAAGMVTTMEDLKPRSMSLAATKDRAGEVPVPDGHPETPRPLGPHEIPGKTRRPAACAVGVETAAKPAASPRLYRTLRCDPQDKATRILVETESLLGIHGPRKITVSDVADACGFSTSNVYRYFSSRRAILDTLASHYLHEAERSALACAIRSSDSVRDRLSSCQTLSIGEMQWL
jgi:hypothetical protein